MTNELHGFRLVYLCKHKRGTYLTNSSVAGPRVLARRFECAWYAWKALMDARMTGMENWSVVRLRVRTSAPRRAVARKAKHAPRNR